jgi:hypothetical protein
MSKENSLEVCNKNLGIHHENRKVSKTWKRYICFISHYPYSMVERMKHNILHQVYCYFIVEKVHC